MDTPYQGGAGVHVLPTNLALPGVGVLPVNAYVLFAEEPVLIDTGIGMDGDQFIEALSSVIDPAALRWVWLTHDDADHTGSIRRVLDLAPNARLATNAFCALRMATWWSVPLDRVHAMRIGDGLDVGDRTLRAVAPPLFDNPLTMGMFDESTGALFSADAFGAILPEATADLDEVPPPALAGGMLGWATSDSPWAHLVDRKKFSEVLAQVAQLQPSRIFSAHLPAARGSSLQHFLRVLETVPDAERFVPPGHDDFANLLAAMTAEAHDAAMAMP